MKMRCVAFDSKDFKRERKVDGGRPEVSFFTPLGVGVAFDDPEGFAKAYIESTADLSEAFGIEDASCIYSASMLRNDIGARKAVAFAQQLVNSTSRFVAHVHFSYVVLPTKPAGRVAVGGERCGAYSVGTEEFLKNLGPMFSYISAWNYKRFGRGKGSKLVIDAFTSKETTAWRELERSSDISIVSHGDEVHPLISFADIVAFLTDIKLYNAKLGLTIKNLEDVWEGVFEVECNYIDVSSIHKIKWLNEEPIDISRHMLKPTVFYISDDPDWVGINGIVEKPPMEKKSKRQMGLAPVRNALIFAALRGCSFRFFDPHLDEKYVSDGDIIVYAGNRSKERAECFEDQYEVTVYKAKEVERELRGLYDYRI